MSTAAVSYTHLDVYKRQHHIRIRRQSLPDFINGIGRYILPIQMCIRDRNQDISKAGMMFLLSKQKEVSLLLEADNLSLIHICTMMYAQESNAAASRAERKAQRDAERAKLSAEEPAIIEKIDIGGISLIRAAAKNYNDVVIIASQAQYQPFRDMLMAVSYTHLKLWRNWLPSM